MIDFEEIDFRQTRIGEISLRRRTQLQLGIEIYEVKLGDEFLMSSMFVEGEIQLSNLGLADLGKGPLDVVVGGLGLGYTARAALDHASVGSLVVIEAIPEVIDWHQRGLVPLGKGLTDDPRCRFLAGDFFALAASPSLDATQPDKRWHAILVDIDHSPRHTLYATHAALYTEAGLRKLAAHLLPGGVFALWSNDPPDAEFSEVLDAVFSGSMAHVVRFPNPLQNREATNTVYVARKPA